MSASTTCASTCQATPAFTMPCSTPAALPPTWCRPTPACAIRSAPGMNELVARVHKIAQGAALMTETSVEMRIISAVSNVLPNTPLEQALHTIMEELGPPRFDEADEAFTAKIRATLTEKDIASVYYAIGMEPTPPARSPI